MSSVLLLTGQTSKAGIQCPKRDACVIASVAQDNTFIGTSGVHHDVNPDALVLFQKEWGPCRDLLG
jgi:hypothetical protein